MRSPPRRCVAPFNDRDAVERALRRSTAARSPRSSSSRWRRTWASCRREPASSQLLRELTTAHGALLIFDEVITGFRARRRRRAALLRRRARPHLPRQDHRRRPARRRLRRPRRHHGDGRAARPRLPGRHALRQPAGDGRRHRHAARCCRTPASIARSTRWASSSRLACATPPRPPSRPSPCSSSARCSRSSSPRCSARLRLGEGRRYRTLRALLPRHARRRRLPPAVAVRGDVRLDRPHAGRPHRTIEAARSAFAAAR